MATQEWINLSVKVTKGQKNLIDRVCQYEGIAVNKFLSRMITKELEPIINPTILPENRGLPIIGENKFKFIPEKDHFIWELDMGLHGNVVLSEEITPFYLESLSKSIQSALNQRESFHNGIRKGAVVPSKIVKYGVRKNAGI